MQIDVHIPGALVRVVPVVIVVEAYDRVWQMTGLAVVVVGGVSGLNAVEANEGKKVLGREGASEFPCRSRHNRHIPH